MSPAVWTGRRQCFRHVGVFISYQTCEHGILKTNEPILSQTGTSGL